MGVLTNGYRDNIGVFRTYGGTFHNNSFPQGTLGNYNRTGMKRNFMAGEGITGAKVGVPNGYGHKSIIMPNKAGGMSSRAAELKLSATGTGAEGYGISGEAAVALDALGIGGLIAGGVGSAIIAMTSSGAVTATIGSSGTATFSLTGSANIGAIGWVLGAAPISISGTLTPYAQGHMVGTTAESGLSNTGIANSVWAKIIEAGFSAEQILRLIAAQAAGAATGLEGSNPQFTGLDGNTVRIDGTYSGGTRTIDSLNGG